MVSSKTVPEYAVFDDYRYFVRVAVLVRWFLLVVWFFLQNYRADFGDVTYYTNTVLASFLAIVNAYVGWRIWKAKPITLWHALGPSGLDLLFITTGIFTADGFDNGNFALYYPALMAMALVVPLRRWSLAAGTAMTLIYALLSIVTNGVDFDAAEEKVLVLRMAAMLAVVAAANLMITIERQRRREAVEAERARERENMELQQKAREAEHAAVLRQVNEELRLELGERRRAEGALERRSVELAAANSELEAFSYSVSHDLQAPVRRIDGFSRAILEDYGDTLTPEAREYLQRVVSASENMGELIGDMLDLSRLTSGEMVREGVDLSAMARSIEEELRRRDSQRELEFLVPDRLEVDGDRRLLRVALENLLGNAWKFTSKRTSPTVELGSTQEDGSRVFFVRDDGAGFDQAQAERLFAPVQRLHDSEEFDGSGIGLATVQRVVHRHGGRIWAEGAVEQGAFKLRYKSSHLWW